MSTIDNRIVRMQFDNEQFERGVMQSMRTLDELNEKLQFKEAGKGISALQVHLNNVDFSGIQNAVQHINHSFTSMTGMVAQHIKEDIVDNVINAAKRLEQVTLGQIKSGGKARAQNIANAKFMIEGLKYDWEAVNKAADYAVTDTAYGLDAAVKAASQLAASGVDFQETIETVNGQDLTQMHKSLRAISGVAAMTNASYDEIAHIFTSVAGMGKLTAMQMNQLSLRGLNIASTIAEQTGKTEQEIREMVSKSQISFQMFADAMDSAYGDHAKDANKTFAGSLSNLKAALSRIGAIFQQPVIDKTNTFFVAVTGRIKEFQKALNDEKSYKVTEKAIARINKKVNDEAKALKKTGKEYAEYVKEHTELELEAIKKNKDSLTNGDMKEYTIAKFATHFAEAWESAINFVSKVTESLDLSWFKSIGEFLDNAAIRVKNFFDAASKSIDKVKKSVDKASEGISDALELDVNDLGLLHRVLKNEFGYVEERWAKLDKIYQEQGSTKTGKWLQGYMDQLSGVGYHFETLGWTEEEFKKKQEDLAKSEAQRVSEMSKEELLVQNLAYVYNNVKHVMEGLKTTVGNVVKSLWNAATAIWKVLTYVDQIGESFQLYTVTDGMAKVSTAVLHLSEALQPSTESLQDMGDALSIAAQYLSSLVEFVFNTTSAFIDFVASCLAANESLDDLAKNESLTSMQRAVLDIMRVINNLRRLLAALGKIAIKIFKSIKTAFMNVFGGQELGGALTAVTGGFTLLTDGIATAAEKVAETEAPFKVIETLFGTIFLIVRKVSDLLGKFTTGIRKFKNGTEDTIDVANNVIKVGEKSSSLVEGLGKTFAKGVKWITELPSKLKTLWETVKKQEGVVHLKESVENLWKTMKDAVTKGMDPMTKSMNEVSRVTGGEGETAFGAFADGIGKVADKIAGFLDKLPEYGNKIKKFFEDTKAWFDKTIADLHLDELGGGLADAFTQIFSTDKSIFTKVKEFAEEIFWQIVDALAGVNWEKVGKGSILTLVAANLFGWFEVTSGLAKTIEEIKDIPKNLAGLVKTLGKVLTSASDSLAKATNAYVLANAAKAILAMAAAIILLKDIPKDDLNKALAALTTMGFIIYALLKAIGYMSFGQAAKTDKIVDKSTKNLLQINSNLGGFAGVALLVFGVGGSIWLVANSLKAIVDACNSFQSNGNLLGGMSAAIQTLMDIIKWVAIIAGALIVLSRINIKPPVIGKMINLNGDSSGGAMMAIGVALIGIGVAVGAMAVGLAMISKYGIKDEAIWAMVGIVSSIIIMTYVIGQSAKFLKVGPLLAIALDMVVMTLAMGIIIGEVMLLSAFIAGADIINRSWMVITSAAIIATLMLAMGASLLMISKGVSKTKKPGDIVAPILSMAVVIISIAWAIKTVSEAVGENLQGSVIAFFSILAILGLVAITIEKTVSSIRTGDSSTKTFLALAAIFAAVGVCIMLMAVGVKQMEGVNGWYIFGAIALIAAVSIALAGVAKVAGSGGSVVAETLESMAIAFVAIGAAVLLIAEAVKIMNGVDPLAFAGAIAIVVVLAGLFAVLAGVSAINAGFADNLTKVGKALKDFGIGAILFAAAALIFGIAMGVMAAGIGALAAGLGVLANAFHEHWVTVVILIGVIALMAFVLHQLVKMCEPIPRIVEDVAEKVTGTAEKAGSGLLSALKKGGSSIAAWWKKAQPQTKAMIVTGIATLCAAILKASPQVLNTAKALLGKLIKFLIDVIPDVVSGLLTILIKIINSLADEIRKNAAKIAYAVWNLLESIFEVILEVLGQLIMMLLGGGKIGQTVADLLSESKGYLRSNLAEMKQYAEQAEDLANDATEGWLRISEQQGSPFASKAMDDLNEYEKQLASAEDQANKTQKAVASINGNNEIPANIAELYAQKGNKQAAENAGEESGEGFFDGLGNTIKDKAGDIIPGGMMPDPNAMFNAGFDSGEYAGEGLINGENFALEEGQSETYTTTTTTIQEGPVAAIEDSEGDIRKATEEHIQKPVLDMVGDDGYRRQLYTRGYSNAGYILRGLKEGMEAQMDMVGNVSLKTAKTINDDFIGPMQIDSPSKLFYEHGAYILQGLANGMEANMNLAAGATSDMSDTIVNSFAAPLDYVSKMASGEIQYDPTIRPVLDSSNIGRGAGAINSMFRNQNVSLSGFSGQLAADIGQLDSRNSDVVDELRALREEMAIMGEEISNMQVVMDTGALVGATAGPMDKALGQRAVRFGRGN